MTRRDLLFTAALSPQVAEALQHAQHASATSGRLETLPAADAQDIEALASQILPSDDGPGAREAGVIYFIDRALGTFDRDKLPVYRRGLEEVRQKRQEMFPAAPGIAELSNDQQRALVKAIETTDFLEQLRTHTVLGFLGNPSYGGNRGGAGWAYIGFQDRMAFQPPFGYYDREEPAR